MKPHIILSVTAILEATVLSAQPLPQPPDPCASVLQDGVYDVFNIKRTTSIYHDFRTFFTSGDFEKKVDKGEIDITAFDIPLGGKASSASEVRKAVTKMTEDHFRLFTTYMMMSKTINLAAYSRYVDCLRGGLAVAVMHEGPTEVTFKVSYWTDSRGDFPTITAIKSSPSDPEIGGKYTINTEMSAPFFVTVKRKSPYQPATLILSHNKGEPVVATAPGAPTQRVIVDEYNQLPARLQPWAERGYVVSDFRHGTKKHTFLLTLTFVGKQGEHLFKTCSRDAVPRLEQEARRGGYEFKHAVSWNVETSYYGVFVKKTDADPIYLNDGPQ